MKLHILISLLFIIGAVFAQQQSTIIRFLVEYEDEQEEDYIELGLVVSAEGSTLVDVMNEARKIAENIKQIATEFCQAHSKKKAECKDVADIGHYDIQPKYQVVKRQSKFMGFVVSHEVAIKVLAVDHISELADTILTEPDTKIVSFEWKPLEEVNKEEAAVKQGTEEGQQLCDELGMHLGSIQNVEEMTQSSNDEVAVYQFEIKCLPGKKAKKEVKAQAKEGKKADKKEDDKGAKDGKKEPKKQEKKQEKKEEKKQEKKQEKKEQKKEEKKEEKKEQKKEEKKQEKKDEKKESKKPAEEKKPQKAAEL